MMYQIVFRMYLAFQCPFQGGEPPTIAFQGSPMEYMNSDHENGVRGLGSSKNGYTWGSKVSFGVGEDL